MKVIYAETSAVLGWLLGEKGALKPAAVIDSADKVVTSALTVLEASRGLLRAVGQRRVTSAAAGSLKGLLAQAAAQWDLMEITAEIRARAAEPFPAEPVRTLDAIHLVTALEFAKIYPAVSILSSDSRILANLEPLGLTPAE